jgi:hypothetical protein
MTKDQKKKKKIKDQIQEEKMDFLKQISRNCGSVAEHCLSLQSPGFDLYAK